MSGKATHSLKTCTESSRKKTTLLRLPKYNVLTDVQLAEKMLQKTLLQVACRNSACAYKSNRTVMAEHTGLGIEIERRCQCYSSLYTNLPCADYWLNLNE